jgi:hypothetical protein
MNHQRLKRHGVRACVLAAILVSGAVLAQESVVHISATIGVDEITPGMRGYGLTVFRGTTPERFDVEVIDVLHNFRPDQDLILIRTPHPILEHAHVVAGMSGSPIFLDGRLAGAYAYGWPYGQEPIAGVTPIANMLTEMRRPYRTDSFPGAQPLQPGRRLRPQRRPRAAIEQDRSSRFAGLPPYLGDTPVTATTSITAQRERLGAPSEMGIQPASTPLLVGGMTDDAVRMLETELSAFGMVVLQTGGGGNRAPSGPTQYDQGSAVAVQLSRGDIATTAVGTVTHVDGARVAAFGHPMINAGETGLPVAVARVLHILSSIHRSFKIAEAVRPVGTLVHDRQSGIYLDANLAPAIVPARVRIRGVPDAPRDEWNVELASHRSVTPVIMASVLASALGATASDSDDAMFEATTRVWIAGRSEPVAVTDYGYSAGGAANPIALSQLRLFPILEMVYGNPFSEQRTERIEVDLSVRFARDTIRILDASVPQREVDPGSTVPVRVVLRRFSRPEEVRIVQVPIPESAAGQNIEITLAPGSTVEPMHVLPRNFEELLATIHEQYPSTSMIVSLEMASRGLRFGGHVADHLPPSAMDALQLRNDGDRNRPFVTYERHEHPLGGPVVFGTARVEIHVRERPRP